MQKLFALVLALVLLAANSRARQSAPGPNSAAKEVVGTWQGDSECAVANSPCHDERNIYRISEVTGKIGVLHVVGEKVVQGKDIVMGSGDWIYDPAKHILLSETSNGTFRLVVSGGSMEGTLTLPDKTVYRRIHLKRAD